MKWVLFGTPAVLVVAIGVVAALWLSDRGGTNETSREDQLSASGELPSGWERFDFGAVAGIEPKRWTAQLLTEQEFRRFAEAGVGLMNLDLELKREIDRGMKTSDLGGSVVVLLGEDRLPTIVLLPCVPGAMPILPADGKIYANQVANELHVAAQALDDVVEFSGASFPVIKVALLDGYDSYIVFFGDAGCTSVANLTAEKNDRTALEVFKVILSRLRVSSGGASLPTK